MTNMRVPDNAGPSTNVVRLRPNVPPVFFLMAGAAMEKSGRLQELAGEKVQPTKGVTDNG
jgi:hypothetical protein